MKYNPNLDSLRGFAALAVIGFHCHVLRCGWVGVQFFFVLSGFLITSILREQRERGGTFGQFLSGFYLRRVLRLVPLYALFLCGLALVYWLTGFPDAFRPAAPYLFTYTLNLARMAPSFPNSTVFSHLWSLGVEWQFYLVWPFVIWSVASISLRRLLAFMVIAAPLVRIAHSAVVLGPDWPWHASLADVSSLGATIYNAPWTHLDAFAFGGLLSFSEIRSRFTRPAVALTIVTATAGCGIAVLGLSGGAISWDTLGYPGQLPRYGEFIWGFTLLNALSAVVLALVIRGGPMARWLTEHRPLHYLGKISYGVYVWHASVVTVFDGSLMARGNRFHPLNLLTVLAVAAITILIAHLSYTFWEERFLRMKDRVAPKSPRRVATVSL